MRIAVCATALALALAACGSSSDDSSGGGGGGSNSGKPAASAPGITANSVTVGGHFPLTGPASLYGRCCIFGSRPMNCGTAGSVGPSNFATTEPNDGRLNDLGKPV